MIDYINIKTILIAVIIALLSGVALYSADSAVEPEPINEGEVSCKVLQPITVRFNPYSSKTHKIVVVQASTYRDNNGIDLTGFSLEVTGSGNEDIELTISCDKSMTQVSSNVCQYQCSNSEGVTIGVDFVDTIHDEVVSPTSYIINEDDGYWWRA